MVNTVGIVGAGLIGRMLAVELARAGVEVTLFDRDGRDGRQSCGWTGAGMLSPYAELESCEPLVFELGLESLRRWPAFLMKLERPVFFQRSGSLILAHARDRAELLRFKERVEANLPKSGEHLAASSIALGSRGSGEKFSQASLTAAGDQRGAVSALGSAGKARSNSASSANFASAVPMQALESDQINELEPDLPGKFSGGLYLADEGQIDNRQLMLALAATLDILLSQWHAPAMVHEIEPRAITFSNGKLTRHKQKFDCVIDARGLGAKKDIRGLRGVRGELITVNAPDVQLNRPIRLMHPRYPLYVVPRENHECLIGATSIESESQAPITVQSALELLSAAFSLHPGFAEASITEMRVNCRPTLSDNNPRIFHQPGLLRVNGLYRHGFMISPKLVNLVVNFLTEGELARDFAEIFVEEKLVGAGVG
jgi:glycine oxidase